jgi:hypothetical protein
MSTQLPNDSANNIRVGPTEPIVSPVLNRGLLRLFQNDEYLSGFIGKAFASDTDTIAAYLTEKILPGTGITISGDVTGDGEVLRIGASTVSGAPISGVQSTGIVADDNITVFDGATGDFIKDSGVSITDLQSDVASNSADINTLESDVAAVSAAQVSGSWDWDSGWTLFDGTTHLQALNKTTGDDGFSNTSKSDVATGVTPSTGLVTDVITTTADDTGFFKIQMLIAQREDVGAGQQGNFLDITNFNASAENERGSGLNTINHIAIIGISSVLYLATSSGATSDVIFRLNTNTLTDLGWSGTDKGMKFADCLIRIRLAKS